jgi:protein-arginine kinase
MRRRIEENRKVKILMRFIIAAALGIQQSTEALLVNKMNELAVRLRENRTEIDTLAGSID